MEYSIDSLAKLAGVTSRTLRYYHQIGLLAPLRTSSAGYRIYGPQQVDELQQILFYRALGMELGDIKSLLRSPGFDSSSALRRHLALLLRKRDDISRLIDTVEKTIKHQEGEIIMTDKEKFEGFKKQLIEENEKKYGDEIREKYGDKTVDASNARMMNLTEQQYSEMQDIGADILASLRAAVTVGEVPASSEGLRIAKQHRRWLNFAWGHYSPEAHAGLCDMYIADSRFTAYYDSECPGCAAFLRDAVNAMIAAEK